MAVDGGDDGARAGSGERLARVTYLPGVVPPPSAPDTTRAGTTRADTTRPGTTRPDTTTARTPRPDTSPAEHSATTDDDGWATAESAPLPDFASFFGEAEEPQPAVVTPASPVAAVPRRRSTPDESGSAPREDALGRGKREVRAENVSMHALTRRGMSRWELEKTLLSREFEPEAVEEELDRLERVGLLDDAALAETLVRTQHERKGLGRSALTAELRRRHIDQQHIDAALEQVDDDDEQSRATELALKRAPQLRSYDTETAKRRLTGFLMRKGYASSVVRSAVDEALSGRSSGASSGVRFR